MGHCVLNHSVSNTTEIKEGKFPRKKRLISCARTGPGKQKTHWISIIKDITKIFKKCIQKIYNENSQQR